jgi:hypothetical protein
MSNGKLLTLPYAAAPELLAAAAVLMKVITLVAVPLVPGYLPTSVHYTVTAHATEAHFCSQL